MKTDLKKKLEILKKGGWMYFNIGWTVVYLIWRTFCTLPLENGVLSIVAGVALLVVEVLGMFEAFVHYFNMSSIENPQVEKGEPWEYPDVDVFIATYNEPTELLYKTVNGCVRMEYPDKKKVHIYLCDDGSRAEVKALADQFGVGYIIREEHKGAKAGNLNHAMSVTTSQYIATFDADMIPKHNFLMETMSYFVAQEKKNRDLEEEDRKYIGFVQTPQNFYNPDLFQYNLFSESRIPNEQDYFYKDVQVARNKTNSVIYGGSNTVISRKALEDVGGFYDKSITEDFATGILIQKKGYICYAINKVLASGLSPTDLKSLISQRVRWARGCISTGRQMHLVFARHLSLGQKANYLASVWYWYASWKRFIYIMSPILFATFHVLVVRCTLVEVLLFWLPMYISSNICLKKMSNNIRTTKWTNVYETTLFPFLMIPTLLETFGISMKKFKVTKKGDGNEEEKTNWYYVIPHATLVVLSIIGILNCVAWTFATGRIDFIVILFWLITNLYNIIMSIFFILGRKTVRKFERMEVKEVCTVETQYETIKGMSVDASESGISILFDEPVDIDENEKVRITINDAKYKACVEAEVVLVTNYNDKWKYAFSVTDMLESKADYIYIIYNNFSGMPENLDESSSSFDDLRINITRRVKKDNFHNRKMARIPMDVSVEVDGKTVAVHNFNYKYILLSKMHSAPKAISVKITENLTLECERERQFGEELYLYTVTNYQEIHTDKKMQEELKCWIRENQVRKGQKKTVVSRKRQRAMAEDEFSEMEYL